MSSGKIQFVCNKVSNDQLLKMTSSIFKRNISNAEFQNSTFLRSQLPSMPRGLVSKHLIPGLDIYSLKKFSAGTQTRPLKKSPDFDTFV